MEAQNELPIDTLDEKQRLDQVAHILTLGILRYRDKVMETIPLAFRGEESVHGLGDKTNTQEEK